MAKVHVMVASGVGDDALFSGYAHALTPAGSNDSGTTWKAALVASGMARTQMTSVGTGPGQITQAEKDLIESGDIIEARFTFGLKDDNGVVLTGQPLIDRLMIFADREIQKRKDQLAAQLRYFGFSTGTVA
jgi:hypothetical protein